MLLHSAKMIVLALFCISGTGEQKRTKFQPSPTFIKRNCLVKKNWPLKARKTMLKQSRPPHTWPYSKFVWIENAAFLKRITFTPVALSKTFQTKSYMAFFGHPGLQRPNFYHWMKAHVNVIPWLKFRFILMVNSRENLPQSWELIQRLLAFMLIFPKLFFSDYCIFQWEL